MERASSGSAAHAARTIDRKTDDVRIYRLCLESLELIGKGPATPTEQEDVVI
jgi:hypothetical protein